MNKNWSEYVQTTDELYRSRALRFNSSNKDIWLSAMKVVDGMNVLEVGCAGGVFCHRMKTFLTNTKVTGIDYDTGHIEYAKLKTKELGLDCNFVTGDATAMPFRSGTFDLCYSHTVMEHVEPKAFTTEQYRVLKQGGKIVILSARPGLNINANISMPDEGEEKELLNRAWEVCSKFEKGLNICAYPLKENEFAPILQKVGFHDININFFTVIPYAPDNSDVSNEIAIESINVNRLFSLNSFYKALKMNPSALTSNEMDRAIELVNKRYDKRIEMYKSGKKLWDFSTSTVMAVTGIK